MTDRASLDRGAFLFAVSHTGNLTIAAEFAGASRGVITKMIAEDASFQSQVADALLEAEERVFYQTMHRALVGIEVPYFYQGEQIATVRQPSDSLLRLVLDRLGKGAGALQQTDNLPPDGDELREKIAAKLEAWLAGDDAS